MNPGLLLLLLSFFAAHLQARWYQLAPFYPFTPLPSRSLNVASTSWLQVRWYQLAAFYPFMRGHAHLEAKRREPWLFGDENTARIRDAIRQR